MNPPQTGLEFQIVRISGQGAKRTYGAPKNGGRRHRPPAAALGAASETERRGQRGEQEGSTPDASVAAPPAAAAVSCLGCEFSGGNAEMVCDSWSLRF